MVSEGRDVPPPGLELSLGVAFRDGGGYLKALISARALERE
jgi:hypothetical protein